MTRLMLTTLLTGVFAIQAMANQPGYLQATKAEYTFGESIPDQTGSGEIVVRMEQSTSKKFSKMQVSAFGKIYDLS